MIVSIVTGVVLFSLLNATADQILKKSSSKSHSVFQENINGLLRDGYGRYVHFRDKQDEKKLADRKDGSFYV